MRLPVRDGADRTPLMGWTSIAVEVLGWIMPTAETGPRQSRGSDTFGRQGFGAMRLRDGTADGTDRDPVAVVHAALDAGVTIVDTADAYQNEGTCSEVL